MRSRCVSPRRPHRSGGRRRPPPGRPRQVRAGGPAPLRGRAAPATPCSCSSWTRTSLASAGGTWASATSSSPRSRRRPGTTLGCSSPGTAADPPLPHGEGAAPCRGCPALAASATVPVGVQVPVRTVTGCEHGRISEVRLLLSTVVTTEDAGEATRMPTRGLAPAHGRYFEPPCETVHSK